MSHLMCAMGRRILGAGIDNGVIGKQNCQFWSILVKLIKIARVVRIVRAIGAVRMVRSIAPSISAPPQWS